MSEISSFYQKFLLTVANELVSMTESSVITLLQDALTRIANFGYADHATLVWYPFQEDSYNLTSFRHVNDDDRPDVNARNEFLTIPSIANQLLNGDEVFVRSSLESNPLEEDLHRLWSHCKYTAVLAIPIVLDNELHGAFVLESTEQHIVVSETLAQLIRTVGSVAISSRRRFILQRNLMQSERVAQEFQEKLKLLHTLNIELARADSIEDLCHNAISLGLTELGYQQLALLFNDQSANDFLGILTNDNIVADGTEQTVFGGEAEPTIVSLRNSLEDHQNLKWNFRVPISDGGRLLGWLLATRQSLSVIPESHDRDLLTTFGSNLGYLYESKRSQILLEQYSKFQDIVVRLASDFINLPIVQIDDGLQTAFDYIGDFIGADMAGLMDLHKDASIVEFPIFWSKAKDKPASLTIQLQEPALLDTIVSNTEPIKLDYGSFSNSMAFCSADVDLGLTSDSSVLIIPGTRNDESPGYTIWISKQSDVYWSSRMTNLARITTEMMLNAARRKQNELAIRMSEHRFRAYFEHNPYGVILTQDHHRVIRANRKFGELLGIPKSDVHPLTLKEIVSPRDAEIEAVAREELISGSTDLSVIEIRLISQNDTELWVSLARAPISDVEDTGSVGIAIIEDISDRKRAEKLQNELARSRLKIAAKLRQMNDDLEERVSSRTHELTDAMLLLQEEIEERKRLEAVANNQQRRSEALRVIAASLNRTLNLDEIVPSLKDSIETLISFDAWRLLMINGERVEVQGVDRDEARLTTSESTLLDTIMTRQKAIIAKSLEGDRELELSFTSPMASAIGVPVFADDQVIAVVLLFAQTPNHFDQNDIGLLEDFCDSRRYRDKKCSVV